MIRIGKSIKEVYLKATSSNLVGDLMILVARAPKDMRSAWDWLLETDNQGLGHGCCTLPYLGYKSTNLQEAAQPTSLP